MKTNALLLIFFLHVFLLGSASAWGADCTITWSPNDPGENVTQYIIDVDGNEVNVGAGSTQVMCSNFAPPVDSSLGKHAVKAAAENSAGRSAWSASVIFGGPEVPANLQVADATGGDCDITWDANPAEDNVTLYEVAIPGHGTEITTVTIVKCSYFTPPVDYNAGIYTVTIRAENSWGTSYTSSPVQFGSQPPNAPEDLAVTPWP